MHKTEVKEVNIESPIKAVGKVFTGDYAKSPQFVMELQTLFKEQQIPFFENKVLGVYYDDPSKKMPEELKSFQGLFPSPEYTAQDTALEEISIEGKYICAKVSGNPPKSIYEGYDALFKFIEKNGVRLESTISYQVSSFENGIITTEIYLKII